MAEQILQAILNAPSRRPAPTPVDTNAEANEYQAFAFGRVGIKALPMIAFVKSDRHHLILPYLDLREIQSLEPENGFELTFPTWKVTIIGRHLATPLRLIRDHRLADLTEVARHEFMKLAESEPAVTEIRYKARKAEITM